MELFKDKKELNIGNILHLVYHHKVVFFFGFSQVLVSKDIAVKMVAFF